VFPRGLGDNRVPGWFSTGADDSLRPPEVVQRAAAASAPHVSTVVTRVYAGGHALSEVEMRELIAWWLGN
jgi:predicted esterase